MSLNNNGGRAGYTAKQFREYYGDKKAGKEADFRNLEDTLYQMLVSKREEVKLEEIYNIFFTKEGKQYDDDSMRRAIQESLKKLCESGKIRHTRQGHYIALQNYSVMALECQKMNNDNTGEKHMKKKILTLILIVTVSVSVLAGCGNTAETVSSSNVATGETETAEVTDNTDAECEHEWVEATCEEAKHCSKCGETEGAALGHTMTEATYKEAAVCTVCGETEGEAKQSYFDEHGVEVADAPVACTVDVLNYNYDNPEKYHMTTDGTWEQIDCYSEPAEEDGYQLIHLGLCVSSQTHYYAAQDIYYNASGNKSLIYDWYTGHMLPDRQMINNDVFDYSITLVVDGISYDVSYTKEIQWEFGDFVLADNGDATASANCYCAYTFKVPDGYDGLVFAAIPRNEYTEPDAETVSETDENDAIYAFDENHYTEGTKFFRINKEGTVPEYSTAE